MEVYSKIIDGKRNAPFGTTGRLGFGGHILVAFQPPWVSPLPNLLERWPRSPILRAVLVLYT